MVTGAGFEDAFAYTFNTDMEGWTNKAAWLAVGATTSGGLLLSSADRGLPPIPPLVLTQVQAFIKVAPLNFTRHDAQCGAHNHHQQSARAGRGGGEGRIKQARPGALYRDRWVVGSTEGGGRGRVNGQTSEGGDWGGGRGGGARIRADGEEE